MNSTRISLYLWGFFTIGRVGYKRQHKPTHSRLFDQNFGKCPEVLSLKAYAVAYNQHLLYTWDHHLTPAYKVCAQITNLQFYIYTIVYTHYVHPQLIT